MTSLTFALSRALATTWEAGDEILVTRLDHDANVTPWVRAAADAGAVVKYVELREADCTLDMDDFYAKLGPKTKLVAVGAASNSVGTINPLREMTRAAHQHDALVFVDAVHFAPHQRMDVASWGCDFLACSTYKFFGPHLGLVWGRRELLEALPAYKVRPAPDSLPGKWMTGTQSHESIVGGLAAIDYLADMGRELAGESDLSRSDSWDVAFKAIHDYEQGLASQFLDGIASLNGYRVWGINESQRIDERVATFSITHDRIKAVDLARQLGERGVYAWHGHYYALQLSEVLGREPDGMLRLGFLHYNLPVEVERTLAALKAIHEA